MGIFTRFLIKKQKEQQNSTGMEGLTSFGALYAQEEDFNDHKDDCQEEMKRVGDQRSLVNEAYMNDDDMYAHAMGLYAPVTIVSSNSVPTTSLTTPKNTHASLCTGALLNTTNDKVILGTLNALGHAGDALKKLTSLLVHQVNQHVKPMMNRIYIFHDKMSTDDSENVSACFMGDTCHSFSEAAQLPGYTLQREASSDSDVVQTGESGIRERSILVLLERLRAGRLGRDFWMKDENCMACFLCDRMFTAWRRRHHCRICGQIFCSQCTTKIPGTNFGHIECLRVCNRCHRIVNAYEGMNVNGEDGRTFSERHWLRSVSQSPFKSNYFMNELFPKKHAPSNSLFLKNGENLPGDALNASESLSPISFRPVTAIDSDTSDTKENYLASSLNSSNIGSLSDIVTFSKREFTSKKTEIGRASKIKK
ncbi:hypothetical protein PCK1_001040 [Pneumocystis canis]|nr:hypothetical protein PCK1_001040 [Pneumocystis canis]